MLKLIVNADDFGLADGCNTGIIRAMGTGIVTDTTLLINGPRAREAVALAQDAGLRGVGLHLNLTMGRPVLPPEQVPSLVDQNGQFIRSKGNLPSTIVITEVEREFRAQLSMFQQTGLALTHLDSHHHVHARPEVIAIATQLAYECAVPLRQINASSQQFMRGAGVKTTDWFTMDFYNTGVSEEHLQQLLLVNQQGSLEIMSHPAEYDEQIYRISSYNSCRENELAILTGATIREFLVEHSIELIGFQQL